MALEIKSRRSTYAADRSLHGQGKGRKRIITTIITVMLLLFLLIGSGIGYTWYMGRYQPAKIAETPAPSPRDVIPAAKKVDDTARVGISSQSFTDNVVIGKNASLSIKTNPLAACSIRVEYDKQASTDSGLVPKKADEYGVASWGWTVEASRPVGKWPVTVTCANAKNSAVLALDMTLVRE